MDQEKLARFHAARFEPRRQRADALMEFAVGPGLGRRIEWRPDQERVFAAALRTHPQQRWHVHPGKRSDDARRCL